MDTEFLLVHAPAHLHVMIAKVTRFGKRTYNVYTNSSDGSKICDVTYKLDITENHLDCIPSKADYIVHTLYKNNVRHLNISTDPSSIRPLTDFLPLPVAADFSDDTFLNASALSFIRDSNLFSIVQPFAEILSGSVNATAESLGRVIGRDFEGFKYWKAESSIDFLEEST